MKNVKLMLAAVLLVAAGSCKKAEKAAKEKVLMVTTFAGGGGMAYQDGTGTSAAFNQPRGVAVDASGNVFVVESGNHLLRKITPEGVVSTIAGKQGVADYTDGTGTAATFNQPFGITLDAVGNVYVADTENNCIRKVTPAGVVSTFAGQESGGFVNGTGTAAKFNRPRGIIFDATGNLYVADTENNCIRKITPAGVVSTVVGDGIPGSTNGTIATARLNRPIAITIDPTGNIYFSHSHAIRKLSTGGIVSTYAGGLDNGAERGYNDGIGEAAKFAGVNGLVCDVQGNLFVADIDNNVIRKVDAQRRVTTYAGKAYELSSAKSPYPHADGFAADAIFMFPGALALNKQGDIYVAEVSYKSNIRKVSWVDAEDSQAVKDANNWNKPTEWPKKRTY